MQNILTRVGARCIVLALTVIAAATTTQFTTPFGDWDRLSNKPIIAPQGSGFESAGTFVDLPEKTVQQPNADLLDLLDVRMRPPAALVVEHVLNCARAHIPVAKRAYEALDNAAIDEILCGDPSL